MNLMFCVCGYVRIRKGSGMIEMKLYFKKTRENNQSARGDSCGANVSNVREDEFRRSLKRMSGEAVGPDDNVAIA